MSGVFHLALRHATAHRGRSAVLTLCLTLVVGLPLLSRGLVSAFESELRDRAETVPLIIGAKGSRFDLVFAALHFQKVDTDPIAFRVFDRLRTDPLATAIPIHMRFTAQGYPVLGTSFEYFQHARLTFTSGRPPARLGEAVIGSRVAETLGLSAGDTIQSDQLRGYDITAAPALLMDIAGVLAPSDGPEDLAVIVDIETAWVLEGIAHGHESPETIEETKLLARTDDHIALSGAVVEYQRITADNADSFHIHGDRSDLPLTGVLLFPFDDKSRTILQTRINASEAEQAVSPSRVTDDLIAFVVRIKSLLDAIAITLGLVTSAMLGLIILLSYRVRASEVRTLLEIGVSRRATAGVFAAEIGVLLLIAAGAALLVVSTSAEVGGSLILRFIT